MIDPDKTMRLPEKQEASFHFEIMEMKQRGGEKYDGDGKKCDTQ